jgi:uncharacterized repeat protein (TIGR03943 family)
MRQRLETPLKALLLIGLGLFLYSRLVNGTLYFYINQSFAGFTVLAVVGLTLVGLSYRLSKPPASAEETDHEHEHNHLHGHAHSHGLTWGGVALVLLPIVLGIAVPPQPLGASALGNRELNAGLNQSTMPGILNGVADKAAADKTILDWWKLFRASADLKSDPAILGQEANVVGFVYQDQEGRYGAEHFMVVRYAVSCCVADAAAMGLVVAWPGASEWANDQWVEVRGVFAPSTLESWQMPILVADEVTPIDLPEQPYLYP